MKAGKRKTNFCALLILVGNGGAIAPVVTFLIVPGRYMLGCSARRAPSRGRRPASFERVAQRGKGSPFSACVRAAAASLEGPPPHPLSPPGVCGLRLCVCGCMCRMCMGVLSPPSLPSVWCRRSTLCVYGYNDSVNVENCRKRDYWVSRRSRPRVETSDADDQRPSRCRWERVGWVRWSTDSIKHFQNTRPLFANANGKVCNVRP